MNDAQTILLFALLLGAIFGAVFADGELVSERVLSLIAISPPVTFAFLIYVTGLASAETALLALAVSQATLIAVLIATDAIVARR